MKKLTLSERQYILDKVNEDLREVREDLHNAEEGFTEVPLNEQQDLKTRKEFLETLSDKIRE
jgi:hypothetical protein